MPDKVTLHYKDGTTAELDTVDARRTLRDHPSEWSTEPFPKEIREAEAEKAEKARAAEDARRAAAAKKVQDEADEKARQEQAEADAEAARIAAQQEAKAKADEEARNGQFNLKPVDPPITNDGLKVGHIPSEVPALEAPVAPFEAREKGRGWWAIYDSKGTQIGGGIREAEGNSFNGLTEEEKQEYVNAELAKG